MLYFASRMLFFLFNQTYFSAGFFSNLKSFTFGNIFDISAISITNSVFILLSFLLFFSDSKKLIKTLKILFVTVNSFVILANYVDIEYFKFIDKRSTYDVFLLIFTGNDAVSLLPRFLVDFWYIPLFWLLNIVILIKFFPEPRAVKFEKTNSAKSKLFFPLFAVFIIALSVVLYRGAGLRPLGINSAAKYVDSQNIPLVLNTPFSIIRSINNSLKKKKYFSNEEEVKKWINPIKHYKSDKKFDKKNIVIIILESFGKDYTGFFNNKPYTPFLDSLISVSLYSKYSFANGKKSMEAMPAILASIPALSDNPFITSPYSADKIDGLPLLLKPYGYYSAFFHGGKNGTMGFDNFAFLSGFDDYFGKNEYPDQNDFDGTWGIYDEEFLQFFVRKMNSFKQPFLTSVFTLSSHHPYTIPEKYKNKFKAGELPIHKAVEYADYSLRKFFESASKTKWYKNTLFVLTADHSSYTNSKYYGNKTGRYAIPILFYAPGDSLLKGNSNIITQQIDIMPSVLDYLHYRNKFYSLGNSVFSDSIHFAVSYISGVYQIIEDDYCLFFDGEKTTSIYNFKTDSLLKHNLLPTISENEKSKLENRLKAFIQTYNNDLIDNKLNIEAKVRVNE